MPSPPRWCAVSGATGSHGLERAKTRGSWGPAPFRRCRPRERASMAPGAVGDATVADHPRGRPSVGRTNHGRVLVGRVDGTGSGGETSTRSGRVGGDYRSAAARMSSWSNTNFSGRRSNLHHSAAKASSSATSRCLRGPRRDRRWSRTGRAGHGPARSIRRSCASRRGRRARPSPRQVPAWPPRVGSPPGPRSRRAVPSSPRRASSGA